MEKKDNKVLVTGANGYVASWIVKLLLDKGFEVHAAVRNPDNFEKNKHLIDIAKTAKGDIFFYSADLLKEGSYDKAMEGCSIVFHTASPFILNVKDNQKDLIDPALEGTRNILNSVNKSKSVKKVVLTSSVAAIYGDNIDADNIENHMFDESFWNTSSNLNHQPYSYSKTVAEKLAWEMNKNQNNWELVVINPSLVFGPSLGSNPTSESFNILKQLGDGSFKSGAPDLSLGVIDVRDLAQAHTNAALFDNANGRNIISGNNTSLLEISKILKSYYGSKSLFPNRKIPTFLIWLLAPFVGMKRKFVSRNFGHLVKLNNEKGILELKMNYKPLKETLIDTFDQLYERDILIKN